jgi:FKBP-type peptidyl-prolyl cis-trans isomerase FklB
MLKRRAPLWAALLLATGPAWSADQPPLTTETDKLSYSIGASVGKNLRNESTLIDVNLLIEGLKAGLAGGPGRLTEREVRQVMNDYQTQLRQRLAAKKQLAIADNKRKGEAYLADYKSRPGVQALPSGVLYKVLNAGSGRKPLETDTVSVNYRGTLVGGAEFDATEAGHPASLKVSSLIAGWKLALTAMPVGSKWQIVVPAALAYGERGVGGDIGPNEVLVFDVELVAIP